MTLSPEKTFAEKQKKQKVWQKIIMLIGSGAFLATAMIPLVTSFTHPQKPQQVAPQGDTTAQLKQQEAGFVEVLQREPDNSNALQGLVQTRLQLGDLEGSVDPLKKLIKMYPNEKVLKDLLAQVENQLGKAPAKSTATPESAPAAPKTDKP